MAVGAAIGATVVGVGGLVQSNKAGKDAKKAQNNEMDMRRQELAMKQQGLDFNQGLLDDWENTFGGLEDNLNDYYSNLDPTKFATQNKQTLNESMDKQMKQFNESMAAQGLQTSGMRVQAEKEAAFGKAQGNAAIDMAAPEQVNQMQQGWLGANKQSQLQAQAGVTGAINGVGAGYGNMGNAYGNHAQQAGQSQSGWLNAGGSMLGSALGLGINSGGFGSSPTAATGPANGGTNVDSLNGIKVDW